MATMIITKCDIDKCKNINNVKNEKIQVIFQTEQTEGRNCKPYLSIVSIDLCSSCKEKVLNGNAIMAYGAQGFNSFIFKKNN